MRSPKGSKKGVVIGVWVSVGENFPRKSSVSITDVKDFCPQCLYCKGLSPMHYSLSVDKHNIFFSYVVVGFSHRIFGAITRYDSVREFGKSLPNIVESFIFVEILH